MLTGPHGGVNARRCASRRVASAVSGLRMRKAALPTACSMVSWAGCSWIKPRSRSRYSDSICPVRCKQRRACGQGLDHGASGIAAARAGAGHAHPQQASDAGVCVGHVAGAGLAPGRAQSGFFGACGRRPRWACCGWRSRRRRRCTPHGLQKTGGQFAHGDAVGGRSGRSHVVIKEKSWVARQPASAGSGVGSVARPPARTMAAKGLAWLSASCWAGTVMLTAATTRRWSLSTGAAMVVMPAS